MHSSKYSFKCKNKRTICSSIKSAKECSILLSLEVKSTGYTAELAKEKRLFDGWVGLFSGKVPTFSNAKTN